MIRRLISPGWGGSRGPASSPSGAHFRPAVLFLALLGLFPALGASSVRAAEELYKLRPGDVIHVTVSPQTQYGRVITIQPDGKINFPVAGELQAAGTTIAQLTRKVAQGLEKELNNPQVTISLQSTVPEKAPQITVLGAVRSPGLFELREEWRLTEALAAAGGPMPNADLRRVTITRADKRVQTIDLSPGVMGLEARTNVPIKAGDLIIVPEGVPDRATATILGEVAKPGAYEIQPGMTLLELLTVAGGATPKADLTRATFARRTENGLRQLDLGALLSGQDEKLNVKLENGDTLIIRENHQRAVVIGEVPKQGEVSLQGGETVLDLLIQAGGPGPTADLAKASIMRRGKDGKPTAVPVDLKKMLQAKNKQSAMAIQHGDLLFIPTKGPQKQSILQQLSPLGFLFGLF